MIFWFIFKFNITVRIRFNVIEINRVRVRYLKISFILYNLQKTNYFLLQNYLRCVRFSLKILYFAWQIEFVCQKIRNLKMIEF